MKDDSVQLQKNFHYLVNNIAKADSLIDHLCNGILTVDEIENMRDKTPKEKNRKLLSVIIAKTALTSTVAIKDTSNKVYQAFLEVLGEDDIGKDLVNTIKSTEVLVEDKIRICLGKKQLLSL
ncbi:Hypothetical predicted protein [Mytilus galloprovincialis]|uniref:CARD domain-containing protein n=1 Tax=Mytilus galloprovincialis TaxID=29158 RepID=A0A8B6D064_MYTGA|nr:Hypothetical predicted protein [Mytilus galloprovincialis]